MTTGQATPCRSVCAGGNACSCNATPHTQRICRDRDWQDTQPPVGTLVEVWATDAQRIAQARWDGAEWHESHWDGDRWTEEGGRAIWGVQCWRSVRKAK